VDQIRLPLPGNEPDGTHITVHRDKFGRHYAKLWDSSVMVDRLGPEDTLAELLAYVALQYPQTSYREQYERNRSKGRASRGSKQPDSRGS